FSWLAVLETSGVFVLILLYIWKLRRPHPFAWILILGLVLASHALRHETAAGLGFRLQNLEKTAEVFMPVVLLLALGLLGLGFVSRTIRNVSPQSGLSSLAFYCIWGLFQQYVLNGFFVNRFAEVSRRGAPLMAAACFSAVHTPNWFLMLVTLAGGFLCAKVYLKFRNLYVLGVGHGVIGFLIYLVVPDTITHHLYVGPKWYF